MAIMEKHLIRPKCMVRVDAEGNVFNMDGNQIQPNVKLLKYVKFPEPAAETASVPEPIWVWSKKGRSWTYHDHHDSYGIIASEDLDMVTIGYNDVLRIIEVNRFIGYTDKG